MTKGWHQQFQRKPKENRTSFDGIVFHSVAEKKRYHDLYYLQKAGEIRALERQVKYQLISPCGKYMVLTPTGKIATYTADFVYEIPRRVDQGYVEWKEVIEDVKGFVGPVEQLRIAVFEGLTKNKVSILKK